MGQESGSQGRDPCWIVDKEDGKLDKTDKFSHGKSTGSDGEAQYFTTA